MKRKRMLWVRKCKCGHTFYTEIKKGDSFWKKLKTRLQVGRIPCKYCGGKTKVVKIVWKAKRK